MARNEEESVAKLIARDTGLKYHRQKFRLDDWGEVDRCVPLKPNCYLFLEVEGRGQQHTCTNVLKVWPYLSTKPQVTVVLAQAFFPYSPGLKNSRGKLGCWLGQRIEKTLGNRFRYHRLVIAADKSRVLEGLDELPNP